MFLALSEGVQVAIIGAIPACLVAVPAIIAARNSKQANRAVNHRKPGEPSMIEMVTDIHRRQGNLETAFLHHLAHDHGKGG